MTMSGTVKRAIRLPRNTLVIKAHRRHAGPMKHRNDPRGGTRNSMLDVIADVEAEYGDDFAGMIDEVGLELYYKELESGSIEELDT